MSDVIERDYDDLRAVMREQILNCESPSHVLELAVTAGIDREVAEEQLQLVLGKLQIQAPSLAKERTLNIGIAIEQMKRLAREALSDTTVKQASRRRKEAFMYLKELYDLQGIRGKNPMAAVQINVGSGGPSFGGQATEPHEVIRQLKMQNVEPELIKQYEAAIENNSSIIPIVSGEDAAAAEKFVPALRSDD